MKSLYTKVPVDEKIALAAEQMNSTSYEGLERNKFVELMTLAVKKVKFKVGYGIEACCVLSQFVVKQFEPLLDGTSCAQLVEVHSEDQPLTFDPRCCSGNTVTRRGYSVQCNRCAYWYHRDCLGLSIPLLRR